MSRWEGWQRTRHDPDTPPDRYQQTLARKVLGELMEGIRLGRLFQNRIRRTFADGTVVIAQFDGTTPMVQVIAPGSIVARPVQVLTSLWIPRGFVFVPGADDAPQGWGLPVRQQPGDTAWPFGKNNLAPGLEVTRWTASGPAAQVLVTRDDTTHYPDERRQMLPIGYDAKEWKASMTWKPKASGWHVVRPTFQGFDWTPDVRGGRMALWRDVTAALDRDLMALPFAGFYDDAQKIASMAATFGVDETGWPAAYATVAQRATKDGARGDYTEAWYANGTAAQLAQALDPPAGKFQIDVGVVAGITTATARPAKDWIQCGNLFWHPADPALPTLTWDGYPAQNLPNWLVAGGWTSGVGSDIYPLEGWHYEWRGDNRTLYSKNLYAMGRCIGVLPDTVIAAAIRKEVVADPNGGTKNVLRVVAITWRASDQFGNSAGIAYFWKFRVWCRDFDTSADVPLHLTDVPIGAYDTTTNPTGWKACGSFVTDTTDGTAEPGLPGNTPWQMYRFNGDGSRAVGAFGPFFLGGGQTEFRGGLKTRELVFSAIGPGELSFTTVDHANTAGAFVLAADYDGDTIRTAFMLPGSGLPFPLQPTTTPLGGQCAPSSEGVVYWEANGAWEPLGDASDFDAPHFITSEYWVLDAATGSMALLDHWPICGHFGDARYDVRLTYGGARIDVAFFTDTANVAEGEHTGMNYLDRLNASCARDRDGHYVVGYDLGTTQGGTPVYASTPVCGQPFPSIVGAAVSSYFGSRWLFDGLPIDLEGLPAAPLRAFPVGVC